MLCSFCSPETQHFQKNNSFSPKNFEIHDAKVVVVLEFIGIIPINNLLMKRSLLVGLKILYIFG